MIRSLPSSRRWVRIAKLPSRIFKMAGKGADLKALRRLLMKGSRLQPDPARGADDIFGVCRSLAQAQIVGHLRGVARNPVVPRNQCQREKAFVDRGNERPRLGLPVQAPRSAHCCRILT